MKNWTSTCIELFSPSSSFPSRHMVSPVWWMKPTVVLRSSSLPYSFFEYGVGSGQKFLLNWLYLGHSIRTWCPFSFSSPQSHCPEATALVILYICSFNWLCPVLSLKMMTCSFLSSTLIGSFMLYSGCFSLHLWDWINLAILLISPVVYVGTDIHLREGHSEQKPGQMEFVNGGPQSI